MLIEDDPGIAELVQDILAERGHRVTVRDQLDGDPADPQAHVVITDLVGLGAFDLAAACAWIERVRATYPAAKVIVSTAHASAARAGAPALGAHAVITKPFDVDRFAETVESLLEV